MKNSKKIAQLKQNAIEIKSKEQLHQIKGGEIIVHVDYRERIIVDIDFRERVTVDVDFRERGGN